MKITKSLLVLFIITSCTFNQKKETNHLNLNKKASTIQIDTGRILRNIQILASDSLEGRGFTKPGNRKAQALIASEFKRLQLETVLDSGYTQNFNHTYKGKRRQRMFPVKGKSRNSVNVPDTTIVGGNIIGMIKGKSDKVIVITGHHDHLGIRKGKIYNGADDDASGAAAVIEIAAYFKDKTPNHTLVFATVDAEESGMLGSSYLVHNFPLGKENIVLNINMDMISHNDKNELYADNFEDDWTNSSDHRSFHKEKIPFIYFGVEDHKDYHKDTDTFENINQEFYIKAVKLIIEVIENYDTFLK
jgi:hypothetical protein